jgi:hypothetical protein
MRHPFVKPVFPVPAFTSFLSSTLPAHDMSSQSIPPISNTVTPVIPNQNSTVMYTVAELEEVKKWMSEYSEGSKKERYELLKGKILPRLFLLNKDLPNMVWKERKSVSMH